MSEVTTIERISNDIMNLQAQVAEFEEAIKFKKGTLALLVENGETYAGEFKVVKYDNKRFDDATAKKNLPAELYEQIVVPKADSKKANALLSGEDLEKCKKTFDPIVKVSLRED